MAMSRKSGVTANNLKMDSRMTPECIMIPLNIMTLFDALITEPDLRDTTRKVFSDGHYGLAVEEAFKHLNNAVKRRSGLSNDGADLMRTAFSEKNPILKMNCLKTESQKNQQNGYRDILAGCMIGIRNPRAHEHRYLDEPHAALEMLALANHLLSLVRLAKKSRKEKIKHNSAIAN